MAPSSRIASRSRRWSSTTPGSPKDGDTSQGRSWPGSCSGTLGKTRQLPGRGERAPGVRARLVRGGLRRLFHRSWDDEALDRARARPGAAPPQTGPHPRRHPAPREVSDSRWTSDGIASPAAASSTRSPPQQLPRPVSGRRSASSGTTPRSGSSWNTGLAVAVAVGGARGARAARRRGRPGAAQRTTAKPLPADRGEPGRARDRERGRGSDRHLADEHRRGRP